MSEQHPNYYSGNVGISHTFSLYRHLEVIVGKRHFIEPEKGRKLSRNLAIKSGDKCPLSVHKILADVFFYYYFQLYLIVNGN